MCMCHVCAHFLPQNFGCLQAICDVGMVGIVAAITTVAKMHRPLVLFLISCLQLITYAFSVINYTYGHFTIYCIRCASCSDNVY